MNSLTPKIWWPRLAASAAVAGILALSGCLQKHLVWSPDGSRAAVIAQDGLHLCDADGRLTPALLAGVYQAAWLGDGQALVVARERPAGDWPSIARALGDERAASIAAQAEEVWRKLEAGAPWGVLTMNLGEKKGPALAQIYLRERHGDQLRGRLTAKEWDELKARTAGISTVVVVRLAGGEVQPGTVLHEGLEKVEDFRVAPGDRAVAFTTDQAPDVDNECRVLVARLDAAGAATVAEHTAAYPDWTAAGRSLVYVQASGGDRSDLRLGTLVRREVLGPDGQVALAPKPEDLAGMLFGNTARVRCLRDGRILFNAVEFTLPIAAKDADVEREELWAWDGSRQSTLVRMIPNSAVEGLPKGLTFFEVSPDEQHVLFGGVDGEVGVLTLATGDLQVLQKAGDYSLTAAPVWRNADEITYARRNPLVDGKRPERYAEIVRQKVFPVPRDQEVVLSKEWPKGTLESVFGPWDRK